jgi:dynein heavy chain
MHSVGGASLLVGVPGTAKTTVVNQFLGRFSPEAMATKTITFSSLTTPQIFQARAQAGPLHST